MIKRIFFILGFLALISCDPNDGKHSIRLAYSNKVNYEPFIIANALGYYPAVGLNVQVKLVTGGIHAAEALITGSADAGAMGDAPAVILAARNAPVKIVARYGKGENIHRMIAANGIQTPADLKGRRIGIHAGSSTHGGFLLWAESKGLNINNMQIIPLNPLDMPAAMQTDQIDAMAGSETWPTNVENLCGEMVHELDDFSGLGNSFPHVFVATKRLINMQPDAVRKLIYATERAIDYIIEHPDRAANITSRHIGLSLEDQKKCTSRLIWGVGWDSHDSESMAITSEYMKRFGKIENVPNLDDYIDIQAANFIP